MIFHVPNKDIQYLTLKIDNVIIEKVDEFNFLGLTMDTNLNWKKHSEKICNKCTKMIVILNRFFFLFFFIFSHFYVGSMCLVRRLHLGRSCATSSDNPLSDKSFLMLSNHLRIGLPLLLFTGTSIPITLFPTYSRNMPIPLQPTLLYFLGYFSHFCRHSNSFIPNSVHLGDSTHPS